MWDAAGELRANSRLKATEYSAPVLGPIFLTRLFRETCDAVYQHIYDSYQSASRGVYT